MRITKQEVLLGLIALLLIIGSSIFMQNRPKIPEAPSNEITKMEILHKNEIESGIFSWQGKLYYLISHKAHPDKKIKESITIFSFPEKKVITSFPAEGMRFGSVLSENGTVYIFLTKDWMNYGKSTVYMLSSTNLRDFTKPIPVVRARTGEGLFNTSVTKNTKTNDYIMALEFDAKGYSTFSIRFLRSKNVREWESIGEVFGKEIYAACPKIKYSNGEYYLWYAYTEKIDKNSIYKIMLAKSANLTDWMVSQKPFLTPSGAEGVNNSDPDIEEYENKTYVVYADGNQATWGNIRYAVINNPLAVFVQSMF